MVYQPEYEKYRGLRALILTRVSSEKQAKRFSHAAQERGVREDIIEPIMLYVIDVIHCTYTGLEYQYNEALDRILQMAADGDFDVLCMDVLDRGLGRKSVARELYRMQLRDFGIHILTTEPSDHSDDDSFEGLAARMRKGLKAEEEILDMVRRTTNGRRQKALGNPDEDILPLTEFHKQCQEWREKLDTPEFAPDFHFYQEAMIFFGITVKVWRAGTEPRYEIYTNPPAIVELLS